MDDRADITISLQEHGRRPDPVHYTDQHLRRRSGYHGPWSDRPDDLAEAALKEAFTCLMLDPIQPPPSHLPGVPSGFKADEKVMRLLDLGIEYLCALANRQPRLQHKIYGEAREMLNRAFWAGIEERDGQLEKAINDNLRASQASYAPVSKCDPREKKRPVYFIGSDDGPIKIGVSHDPRRRLADLQRSSPAPLRILALTKGGFERENAYHLQFKGQRLYGEWFERCPEILAEIERLSA